MSGLQTTSTYLGYEPVSGTLSNTPALAPCAKSASVIANRETGEVIRANTCDRNSCPACAPARCLRVARHAAWALSAAPYVWLVTVTPVNADPGRSRLQMARLASALRRHGEFGYLYAVESEGQVHAHAVAWSDFDIREHSVRTRSVHFDPVKNNYFDRYNVAKYVTKTVHRDGRLEKHLALNGGRLWGASKNFWYGFLDYRHVCREYRAQEGWKVGAVPKR